VSKLAKEIWEKHVDSPRKPGLRKDEIKTEALHSALVTLEAMKEEYEGDNQIIKIYQEAIDYLKNSKYYSEENKDADY